MRALLPGPSSSLIDHSTRRGPPGEAGRRRDLPRPTSDPAIQYEKHRFQTVIIRPVAVCSGQSRHVNARGMGL